MKKLAVLFALLGLFIAGGAWAGPPTMIYPAAGISTASDCNVAAYYAIGKLCQDTDDGKLYKGTGAAVEEVGATTIATAITVADTTDATSYCALFESATGDLGPKTDGGCTYAADTGTLTVTGLTVGAGGITTAASASPTAIYNDSDAPGADKEIAKTVGAYIDGADGAENGTLSLYAMIAGTDTEMLKVDGKNSLINLAYPTTITATGVKLTGSNGSLTILGLGDGADEDVKIDLNTTANSIDITSPASSATQISLGSLNLVTTGTISGAIPVVTDADGRNLTAAECYGTMHVASGAGTWLLPAAAAGMNLCVLVTGASDVIIDIDASDDITLVGVQDTDGDGITNATGSSSGDFVCLVAIDATHWYVMGKQGTWTAQ
jgi:hypothetical protein